MTFFSGKFEIWPFWPIFGQKWANLAQNGLFWSIFVLFFQNSVLTFADFLHKVDSQYSNVETVSGYPVKIQNGEFWPILATGWRKFFFTIFFYFSKLYDFGRKFFFCHSTPL